MRTSFFKSALSAAGIVAVLAVAPMAMAASHGGTGGHVGTNTASHIGGAAVPGGFGSTGATVTHQDMAQGSGNPTHDYDDPYQVR